jgi:hypothetical protein
MQVPEDTLLPVEGRYAGLIDFLENAYYPARFSILVMHPDEGGTHLTTLATLDVDFVIKAVAMQLEGLHAAAANQRRVEEAAGSGPDQADETGDPSVN